MSAPFAIANNSAISIRVSEPNSSTDSLIQTLYSEAFFAMRNNVNIFSVSAKINPTEADMNTYLKQYKYVSFA